MTSTDRATRVDDHLADRVFASMNRAAVAANLVGVLVVFAFLAFAFPRIIEPGEARRLIVRSAIVLVAFLLVALPLTVRRRRRRFAPVRAWLDAARTPTPREQLDALRMPRAFIGVTAPVWAAGAVVFGCVASSESLAGFLTVAVTVLLGGLATSASQYLLLERIMRPVVARALAGEQPAVLVTPGVTARVTMSWALGTAVPLLGAVALGVARVAGADIDAGQTVGAMTFLTVVALIAGLLAIRAATSSIAGPVEAMRDAVARVGTGDFDARVTVDDASEIGLLEAGFNRMAAGLAERERIRSALGTYLDHDVAEHILREGTSLEGEDVEVTMLFLDVRDFTGFAERSEAREVVAALNELFERVVPCIHEHGGHVDKFVGDGLLAIFGAPRRQERHAESALAAAVAIARSMSSDADRALNVGIGLNSGNVVAGNVGGGGRLEFSVIGDAVNVAARVEAATRTTGDVVLLSEATERLIERPEVALDPRPAVQLKGKRDAVTLYAARVAGDCDSGAAGAEDEAPDASGERA